MTDSYSGRLELTWTNKHLCLLEHDDGSYEWVEPSDYRVAEVRLLHDVTTVGAVGERRAADNLLIRGDALRGLTSLAKLPEFAAEYHGKVKLTYLDPPFNTLRSFLEYEDNLEHSVWLTMMRERLMQVKDLLAPDGSIYVHCDASRQPNIGAPGTTPGVCRRVPNPGDDSVDDDCRQAGRGGLVGTLHETCRRAAGVSC